jgi:hypothetical protein
MARLRMKMRPSSMAQILLRAKDEEEFLTAPLEDQGKQADALHPAKSAGWRGGARANVEEKASACFV